MDVTIQTYQTFLDDAWDAAPQGANTLRDQLRAFEKTLSPLFNQGSLASVSKNSASQTYRGPGLGSYTTPQITKVWRDLINLYDHTLNRVNCLLNATIKPNPLPTWWPADNTDNTLYGFMKYRLVECSEYSMDMTYLRLPPTEGLVPEIGGSFAW